MACLQVFTINKFFSGSENESQKFSDNATKYNLLMFSLKKLKDSQLSLNPFPAPLYQYCSSAIFLQHILCVIFRTINFYQRGRESFQEVAVAIYFLTGCTSANCYLMFFYKEIFEKIRGRVFLKIPSLLFPLQCMMQ